MMTEPAWGLNFTGAILLNPSAKAYYAWKQSLQELNFDIPSCGAVIVFRIPMPKSWSKKKRDIMRGTKHQQTPDLVNLLKAAEDAARYKQGDEDIWHYGGLMKRWADEGSIEVRVP